MNPTILERSPVHVHPLVDTWVDARVEPAKVDRFSITEAVALFVLEARAAARLSPNSLKHYRHDLLLFVRYMRRHHPGDDAIHHVTTKHVRGFLTHMERCGNSPSSNRRRLAALRTFFAHMIAEGYVEYNPTAPLKPSPVTKERPVALTRLESLRLLQAATMSRHPRRDHAIFRLFLTIGCTLSEVLNLKLEDVNLGERSITLAGRGHLERTLTLSEKSCDTLASYLEVREKAPADTNAFFLNRHGNPISKGAVYHAFENALRRAGISKEGLTVHSLRHTSLAFLWRAGVSLQIIQQIAGHRMLATTREYAWAGPRSPKPRPWTWVHPLEE